MRGGNSSVVRAPDSIVIERSRVRVQAGAAGEFASQGQPFVLTLISVSVPPVLPQ